jgi:hypothetical protein
MGTRSSLHRRGGLRFTLRFKRALRGRSLRDWYTGFALGLPMVGSGDFLPVTNGSLDPKEIAHYEVIALRAGGPSGRPFLFFSGDILKA